MTLWALLLAVWLGACAGQHQNKLAFQVEARAKECFYLEVGKEETGEVTVQVSVIKGGLLDILIDVFDPHDNKLFSRMFFEGKGDSDIKFTAEQPGDYQVCFNNEMARWTAKVVAMKMFVSKHAKPSSPGDSQPVTPADVDPLEARLDALANTLSLVSSEQAHFKYREAAHSAALKATRARITYYSLFESSVLVALSLLQIYFVRKWFDTPSYARARV